VASFKNLISTHTEAVCIYTVTLVNTGLSSSMTYLQKGLSPFKIM
jgi:hypothetical protein